MFKSERLLMDSQMLFSCMKKKESTKASENKIGKKHFHQSWSYC